jgi:pimeloyl-ACP methyl ester carboxylesterase
MRLSHNFLLIFLIVVSFLMGICPSSLANDDSLVGVVLLHGKTGLPAVVSAGVSDPLRQAGFLVETPEMPWSRNRYIDKTLDMAFSEIDQAVAHLKAQGAKKIVLAGHSMGGDIALAYAANRGHIAGIILLVPASIPDMPGTLQQFAPDVARAKQLIDAGHGDQVAAFIDFNMGKEYTRQMKAAIYYSYFDPQGLGAAGKNAVNLSPDIPVLYVGATGDITTQRGGKEFIFDKLPENPVTKYVLVTADHMSTPQVSVNDMITWLHAVADQ